MPYVKLRVKRWRVEDKEYLSYQLTAPKSLVEKLGWKVGEVVHVKIRDGELVYSRSEGRVLLKYVR
ncbi:MAG: AbrB/MazE/SpoVT family DNA-binding domain-containing protein [Candidatus Korarchaeum sp.]|nr:AbrB/MazE/SpoVT family DNA-binding domain-containing protein [Candidatus Korarchaeum sp.]MDW8035593.1 AbrB/MazE/SpoVT family DNA-binding domain-containing protein [Candidatus Korarchaeum sp.]